MTKADTFKSIFFCLFLWLPGLTSAQMLSEGDLLLQPSELLEDEITGSGHSAYIQQVGSSNEVELWQQNLGGIAGGNLSKVLQSGNWNMAVISQNGEENQLALIQFGNENYVELLNSGFGNELAIIQNGEGNKVIQHLTESNLVRSALVQTGNNNEIITILEGMQGSNISIRQIGDGLKVFIKQSSF